jgi:hypothetical protein
MVVKKVSYSLLLFLVTTISLLLSSLPPPDPFHSLPLEGQFPATTFPNSSIQKSSSLLSLINHCFIGSGLVFLVIIGFGILVVCRYLSPTPSVNLVVGVPVAVASPHGAALVADNTNEFKV